MKNVQTIDGTDNRMAPRPRRGLVKACYDVLEGIGLSSEAKIYRYLPTVISSGSQVCTKKKLHSCLYNAVYVGYFVTVNDKYRIAPLSYYEARQKVIAEQQKDHKITNKKPHSNSDEAPNIVYLRRPFWHWYTLAITASLSLLTGIIIGMLLP